MTEKIGSVWAVDIGNTSLKALRLSNESGTLEVIGFDHIPHGKVLSGTGVKDQERQELIALSVRQFVQQNDIGKDEIIVAVPSQNSFARFVNLPPVEAKRIPEIVRFEASQQIPFDITDVAWDWQMMKEGKVGIFAIKNEVVTEELEHFSRENLQVSYVQISPMALYNYVVYDRPDLTRSDTQATVVLNVGAENTDLVVCTESDVWQRTIPMGGNAFTKAISDTFKLSFEKAEKLKRTAPMSKYARQILQAMKPVFAELAAEIQRSIGFYNSAHPNTKLAKIVALGGGTRMRGLLQYLQQSLQIPIERPDAFKRIAINPAVSAAKFHENVADFAIVYGLAIQTMGLGRIECNLLPRTFARSMAWSQKTKYFLIAATLLLVASVLALARTIIDRASYTNRASVREKVRAVINVAGDTEREIEQEKVMEEQVETAINKEFELFKYRDVLPMLHRTIIGALPNGKNNPDQAQLYRAFAAGDVEGVKQVEREQRKQLFVTELSVYYTLDLPSASFGVAGFEMGIGQRQTGVRGTRMDEQMYLEMLGRRGGGQYTPPGRGGAATRGRPGQTEQTEDRGFVVTIAGYSPYGDITELLDPARVQDDKGKWGFVTRLMNLDAVFDGNSPFELYKKTDKNNFEVKAGEVDLEEQMPIGIGISKTVGDEQGTEHQVLVDPMTNEVISRVAKVDNEGKTVTDRRVKAEYEVNDHWYVVNFKLKWKVAPEPAKGGGADQ